MARRVKYYSRKRRAIMAKGEDIVALEIFERDNWICGLCSKPINRYLRCPSWWAATLDHIIPLSKGGQHIASNIQAAHLRCNTLKGNTFIDDTIVT